MKVCSTLISTWKTSVREFVLNLLTCDTHAKYKAHLNFAFEVIWSSQTNFRHPPLLTSNDLEPSQNTIASSYSIRRIQAGSYFVKVLQAKVTNNFLHSQRHTHMLSASHLDNIRVCLWQGIKKNNK